MSNHTDTELKNISACKKAILSGVSAVIIKPMLWPVLGFKGARRIVKLWIKGKK